MTRQDYISRFDNLSDAIRYEHQTLSAIDPSEHLAPGSLRDEVTQVIAGDVEEPSAAYWQWLCESVDQADAEAQVQQD